MKTASVALIVAILAPVLAAAEDARPVVAVMPFTSAGVGEDETKTIENLVESYVSEIDDFRLVAQEDRDLVLSEWEFAVSAGTAGTAEDAGAEKIGSLLAADYILSGSVGAVDDSRVLTLEVVKVKTGEKRSVSALHPSLSELALDARSVVRRAFDRERSVEDSEEGEKPVELSEDLVAGSWRGDKGIELVRILRGGKALAILSSGAKMELQYSIEGGELHLTQASANTERFYHPIPYKVAVQLVLIAQPMEWRLKPIADGSVLRGTKTTTAIRYDQEAILEVTRDSVRDAEWTRLSR